MGRGERVRAAGVVGAREDSVSEATMRTVPELHRVAVGCPCGETFTLPIDGSSYHAWRCGRIYDHGWRSDEDHERFLAIHTREAWERMREARN